MSYQPRSTNPYIMEKKLDECVGGGGFDPSVLEEIEAEISVLGSENTVMAQDIIDIKGSLNSINDKLTQLAVGKRSNLDLSGYTAESLLASVSNNTAIWMTYTSTAERLSDLPISSAGAYIIFNPFNRVLVFLGYTGNVYYYISGSGWQKLH